MLVAYQLTELLGATAKPCLVVIYLVCAGIGAAVGVESLFVGILAEIDGNRAGEVARQGNTLVYGNSFLLSSP